MPFDTTPSPITVAADASMTVVAVDTRTEEGRAFMRAWAERLPKPAPRPEPKRYASLAEYDADITAQIAASPFAFMFACTRGKV